MPRVLIIGYGNTLRGDDAFGPTVAELLLDRLHDPSVEILSLHQLTPELMEPLSRADLAIFIDAAASGEPGSLVERTIEASFSGPAFTHHATPEALLAGARALYGRAPAAHMISAAGADFELGADLSPVVAGLVEDAVARALRFTGTVRRE